MLQTQKRIKIIRHDCCLISTNKNIIMKKLFFLTMIASFAYFGASAQVQPGNSAFGHSHKKYAKHYYRNTGREDGDRRDINYRHRTAIRTIQRNDTYTNGQSKDLIRNTNIVHRDDIRKESHGKKDDRK